MDRIIPLALWVKLLSKYATSISPFSKSLIESLRIKDILSSNLYDLSKLKSTYRISPFSFLFMINISFRVSLFKILLFILFVIKL